MKQVVFKILKTVFVPTKKKIKVTLLLCGIVFVSVNILIHAAYKIHIHQDTNTLMQSQAVMILGAYVYGNGRMSSILQDRVDTALELYRAEKVEKVLISGDHGTRGYDEVNTVKNYLLEQKVPEEDIFMDHAGFDTYDSMYRAKSVFGIETLTISTQKFHLPRALFIARSLGIDAQGKVADKQVYRGSISYALRESLASIKAYLNVALYAKPKYLGETIPITGDGRDSWD